MGLKTAVRKPSSPAPRQDARPRFAAAQPAETRSPAPPGALADLDAARERAERFGHDFSRLPAEVALQGMAGPRRPLPHLEQLEQSFGVPLAGIPSYQGPEARAAADALDAEAYTHRGAVVLGSGTDLATVAEETAHALQQGSGRPATERALTRRSGPAEREAAGAASAVAAGLPVGGLAAGLAPQSVARSGKGGKDAEDEINKKLEQQQERGLNVSSRLIALGGEVNRNPHAVGTVGAKGGSKDQRHAHGNEQAITNAKNFLVQVEGVSRQEFQSSAQRKGEHETKEEIEEQKDEEKVKAREEDFNAKVTQQIRSSKVESTEKQRENQTKKEAKKQARKLEKHQQWKESQKKQYTPSYLTGNQSGGGKKSDGKKKK